MLCKQCGKEIKEGSNCCEYCGKTKTSDKEKKSILAETMFIIVSIISIFIGIVSYDISKSSGSFESILLIFFGISSICMSLICTKVAKERGIKNGFLYGWFLGLIGLVMIAAIPVKKQQINKEEGIADNTDKYDQVKKLKELLDSGAITEEEFNREKKRYLSRQNST